MTIHKDELVILEQGEYSDFRWIGLFKALRDFHEDEVARDFKASLPEEDDWEDIDKFVPFLVKEGYLEEIEVRTWPLGAYHLEANTAGKMRVHS